MSAYLPVLGLALEHHGVFGLADLAIVDVLDLGSALLGLNAVILGEGALVAGTAGVGKEVRADRLDGALGSARDLANGLEVLVGVPAIGKAGEREIDGSNASHRCGIGGGDD